MAANAWIEIGTGIRLPRAELRYHATRAGGPGGQHVNTSSTRIELWWNLEQSPALAPGQRALARSRLGTRLDTEGWLRLVESGSRSQLRNKEAVTERFAALLNQALRPPKVRKPTKVPKVQKLRRLASKKSRAEIKKLRERIRGDE